MLKVVIAEDDQILRENIIKKVSLHPEIEVMYSTDNGTDFLEALLKIKPEIIIADISMPGMSGLEVIKIIRDQLPGSAVIFITSFGEFLKDAVELYAYDYLQKPVDYQRLDKTINRIKDNLLDYGNLIQFKTDEGIELVKEHDIYLIEAATKKTIIYTKDRIFYANYLLKELEKFLNQNIFFKTSRSYIVNIQKVHSLKKDGRTSFKILFLDKEYEGFLSKKNYQAFRQAIKKLM